MKSHVEMYEINTEEVWNKLSRDCWRPNLVSLYVVNINSRGEKSITFCLETFLIVENVCPYYTNKRGLLGS